MNQMQSGAVAQLDSLFETTRKGPQIAIERTDLDARFITALAGDKHILVHGPARLGKTTLLKKHLDASSYCLVECQSGLKKADIYRIYLADGGLSLDVEKRTSKKLGATASVKWLIGSASADAGRETEALTRSLTIDLGNASDVIRLCVEQSYERFLVLNNFQQLAEDVALDVIGDLGAFYERSNIRFVFVGVTNTPDKFIALDQRTDGTIESLCVGPFSEAECDAYFDRVGKITRIPLPPDVRQKIVDITQGNIWLISKLCRSFVTQAAPSNGSAGGTSAAFISTAAANLVASLGAAYERGLAALATNSDLRVQFKTETDVGSGQDPEAAPEPEEPADVKVVREALAALANLPEDADRDERRTYVKQQLGELLEEHTPAEDTHYKFLGLAILSALVQKKPDQLEQGVTAGELSKELQAGVLAGATALDEQKLLKMIRRFVRAQDDAQPQLAIFSYRSEDESIVVTDHAFLVFLQNRDPGDLLDSLRDAAEENQYALESYCKRRARLSD